MVNRDVKQMGVVSREEEEEVGHCVPLCFNGTPSDTLISGVLGFFQLIVDLFDRIQ